MALKIFISYRRDDEPGYTQALFQRLEAEFGSKTTFLDVEGSIKAGQDFVQVLEEQVSACDIMLVVIGPKWIDAKNEKGQPRLEDPEDFVRLEIVSALEHGKHVIPVLIGAPMPTKDQLPTILRSLTRRQALRLTRDRFNADCQGLLKDIREVRDAADAALTAQESQTAIEAERREAEAWSTARGLDSFEAYEEFLRHWPSGTYSIEARSHLRAIKALQREAEAWSTARGLDSFEAYEEFLCHWPSGRYSIEARSRLSAITYTKMPSSSPETLRVRGHSNFFYWWFIWFYSYICALITLAGGRSVELFSDGRTHLFHQHAWVGISFVTSILFVGIATNINLGIAQSLILLLLVTLFSLILLIVGIFHYVIDLYDKLFLQPYVNFDFYILFATILLIIWLFVTFKSDRSNSWILSVGHIDVKSIGMVSSFTYEEVTVRSQANNFFVNYILGLSFLGFGTGDIELRFGGREVYTLKNVWRARSVTREMQRMIVLRGSP